MKGPGRLVNCSNCGRSTCQGTTQVFRKIVFHFCVGCWRDALESCQRWMQGVAA